MKVAILTPSLAFERLTFYLIDMVHGSEKYTLLNIKLLLIFNPDFKGNGTKQNRLRMRKGLRGRGNMKHRYKTVPVRTWRCPALKCPTILNSDLKAAQRIMGRSFGFLSPLCRGPHPVSALSLSSFCMFFRCLLPPCALSAAL